jgi:hypothetical protein
MHVRPLATRAVVTAGATAITTCLGLGVTTIAVRAASTQLPTLTAHMSSSTITLSGPGVTASNGGYSVRAGRYHFHVVSVSGDHALEIVALHNGYTQQQAQQDFGSNGPPSVAAVQRIDHGVLFYGGGDATSPKHPADFVATLPAASMVLTDFNGNAQRPLTVTGKPAAHQGSQPSSSTFNAYVYGWVPSSSHIPHKGWLNFANRSDQPHILVLQHVKSTTTRAMVRRFIASGANGNPPWGLPQGTQAGVVSPNHSQLLKYNLPAGKYLVMCFWPDYFDGMPHFMMGMWNFVTLT